MAHSAEPAPGKAPSPPTARPDWVPLGDGVLTPLPPRPLARQAGSAGFWQVLLGDGVALVQVGSPG